MDRDVALKVLPRFVSFDPERLYRFEQEAKAAAALNHPNILAVFHMGKYESAPYLVSELLEGETLRQQLKHGSMPLKKAIDYSVQIVQGLAAAHEKGIVYRDLKPENLFVTTDGRIKILDFGLAKLTHQERETRLTKEPLETEPGAVLGTVGYMSPEQVRGQIADHRSDIFAFGAILYEMLSGRRAFTGKSAADVTSAILKDYPPRLSKAVLNIPKALESVIERCLEKKSRPALSVRLRSCIHSSEMGRNSSICICPVRADQKDGFTRDTGGRNPSCGVSNNCGFEDRRIAHPPVSSQFLYRLANCACANDIIRGRSLVSRTLYQSTIGS